MNDILQFDASKTWSISTFLNKKDFRFCGGEPTINPNICEIADLLLKQDYEIFFMTNGIWNNKFTEYIKHLPFKNVNKIRYLFNVLEPSLYKNNEIEILKRSLATIINPLRVTLGFTIYKEDFNYEYLIDLALEYNIKNIRWSVASPNISNYDENVGETKFSRIANKLYELHNSCISNNLILNGDCNYIQPCFWDNSQLSELLIKNAKKIQFNCSNGSPVDIGADGMAWRCYGLYSVMKTNISKFKNDEELEKYFTRRVKLLNNMFAYEECQNCQYWQKGCNGGCYVYRIKRAIKQKSDIVLFPIDNDVEILKCKPFKKDNVIIKTENEEDILILNYTIISNEDENTLQFLKNIDGEKSINELISMWKDNFSSIEKAQSIIIAKCRELFDKDYIGINYQYDIVPGKKPSKPIPLSNTDVTKEPIEVEALLRS
jgi:hypothetical protein